MNVLILDGTEKTDEYAKTVNTVLNNVVKKGNSTVTNVRFHEHEIHSCIGDFGCFFKTPGKCIFKDVIREVPEQYIGSNLVVLITAVTFGGYSSLFAKAFDRIAIQLESHLFMYSEGEIHRHRRYNKEYPSLFVIGIEETRRMENRSVFKTLVQRNAFHLFAPEHHCLFLTKDPQHTDPKTIERLIEQALSDLGGKYATCQ